MATIASLTQLKVMCFSKAGVLSGHNRMTSHPELDLAIGHYAPHHPIPAYFYNYGPPMQHYHVTPYPPYPNMAGPHPNFINAPQIIP